MDSGIDNVFLTMPSFEPLESIAKIRVLLLAGLTVDGFGAASDEIFNCSNSIAAYLFWQSRVKAFQCLVNV